MHSSFPTSLLLLCCALTVSPTVKAQPALDAPNQSVAPENHTLTDTTSQHLLPNALFPLTQKGVSQKQWLWGVGHSNVLDTYLSPLEYTGPHFTLLHQSERKARWGRGSVTTHSLYAAHAAYLHSPTDDGKAWDGEFSAAGGWLYNWQVHPRWRLAVGGWVEVSGGFTYNTRNGNNPAQGRLGLSLNPSLLVAYRFPFFRKTATARLQADAQLLGVQFSPSYGQSYYEIFSLGHTSGIIHFTQPGNCPTTRLQALVTLPVWGAKLTLGYLADIRQSQLGGLKRHAWRNTFVLGYTRTLKIFR